jgi:hypothetical protein
LTSNINWFAQSGRRIGCRPLSLRLSFYISLLPSPTILLQPPISDTIPTPSSPEYKPDTDGSRSPRMRLPSVLALAASSIVSTVFLQLSRTIALFTSRPIPSGNSFFQVTMTQGNNLAPLLSEQFFQQQSTPAIDTNPPVCYSDACSTSTAKPSTLQANASHG